MDRPIITWKSKIQIKKGTPIISLTKLLREAQCLYKGKELYCCLIQESSRIAVIVFLDGNPVDENNEGCVV
jgi:hypothetical protein